jgi:hypothetical protein
MSQPLMWKLHTPTTHASQEVTTVKSNFPKHLSVKKLPWYLDQLLCIPKTLSLVSEGQHCITVLDITTSVMIENVTQQTKVTKFWEVKQKPWIWTVFTPFPSPLLPSPYLFKLLLSAKLEKQMGSHGHFQMFCELINWHNNNMTVIRLLQV